MLRDDLRLVVMSATIDGARFAAVLDDAPVIESEGRAWPLEIRWLGARAEQRVDEQMAGAVLTAAWAAGNDWEAKLPLPLIRYGLAAALLPSWSRRPV